MMRIVWSTDIHLDFVSQVGFDEFVERLRDAAPDVVLIGGDIAESRNVVEHLGRLDDCLPCPIYFVLGNHDFYHGSIAEVRYNVARFCEQREKLCYLTANQCVEIAGDVGLIGHDGWGDGRAGDYEHSEVMLNDYWLIEELAGLEPGERWTVLKQLGDEAAAAVRRSLSEALDRYRQVFFLTHPPPFREACWHNGAVSDDQWAPHFTCKAVGDALVEIASQHAEAELTVLCGHTHSPGEYRPLRHVRVVTGGAEYGFPTVNHVFRI